MKEIERAFLPGTLRRSMAETCRRRLPQETCGVLFGHERNHEAVVEDFAVIRNVSPHPEAAFAFDPQEWIQAHYEALKKGRTIIGLFHSHPDGSTVPSPQDADGWLACGTYWIIGMTKGDNRIAAYRSDGCGGWVPLRVASSSGMSS